MKNNLREELLAALQVPGAGHGDLPAIVERLRPKRADQAAAVLVGVVAHPDGPTVLLTRRTDHLVDHAGQVSFPGGRVEPRDRNAVRAALREAEEEIGLPPSYVDVLGTLAPYRTITNFMVTPVLALVRPGFTLQPDVFEVAEVFEVPLALIRDPARRQRRSRTVMGVEVGYWAYEFEGHLIWGATAAMLVEFCQRLERVTSVRDA